MIAQHQIQRAVRILLEAVHPAGLSPDEILDRLPFKKALIAQCRAEKAPDARVAAAAKVREGLAALGGAIEPDFDEKASPNRRIIFRLTEGLSPATHRAGGP